jgi:hypothetical protein
MTMFLLLIETASVFLCFCTFSAMPLHITSVDLTRSQEDKHGDLTFQIPRTCPDLVYLNKGLSHYDNDSKNHDKHRS